MHNERLSWLVDAYLDGQLTADEKVELEDILRSSATARAQFWRDTQLHGLLHESERGEGAGSQPRLSRRPGGMPAWPWWPAAILMAVLVIAAFGIGRWWQPAAKVTPISEDNPGQPLAHIREENGARWAGTAPGVLLSAGDWELQSGVVDLMLFSGAQITVQAPARFRLVSRDHLHLRQGSMLTSVRAGVSALRLDAGNGSVYIADASLGLLVDAPNVGARVFSGTPRFEGFGKALQQNVGASRFPIAARDESIPVGDAGFEPGTHLGNTGIPTAYNQWGGDICLIVGDHQGIQPATGQGMLRFLRAENIWTSEGKRLVSSEQWQLVDLASLRPLLRGGRATVELAAWFNRVPGLQSTRRCGVSAYTFRGAAADAPTMWKQYAQQALSYAGHNLNADDDPATWERSAVQLTIPEDADFLLITVRVSRMPLLPDAPPDFEGHYADDVSLRLHIPPQERMKDEG